MSASGLSPLQRFVLAVLGVGWLSVVIGGTLVAPPMIDAAYRGESIDWLNKKIAGHRERRLSEGREASQEFYASWARGYTTKGIILTTLAAGVTALLVGSRAARWRVKRYLFASTSPLNLAVARIAVFGVILYLLATEPIMYYASWSRDMYQWPVLAKPTYSFLPLSPQFVGAALTVAYITTTMTVVGLFTRTSAIITVLLAWYLIGVPQLGGKVNHWHHVVLIGMVLACSRSGDALSLDAVWRAVRRADRGVVAPVKRAVRYGLPIRVSLLVLSTVYFFPGFWKLVNGGMEWIFSDNLEVIMMQKWFTLEHFTPPLPLHKLPFAGQMGALTSVIFEVGIPLALLWKPTRILWGVLGITFHNLTRLLMNISFVSLQVMYVMFVDWQRLLRWVGKAVYGEPMRILYDGNCGLCRRTMGVLGVFDWMQQLKPVNGLSREAVEGEGLGQLSDADLVTDMHAAWRRSDGDWGIERGYAAYQQIAWRVPLLWLTLPVVYLPPVAAIGGRIYRRVADSRACRVPTPEQASVAPKLRWVPSWSAGPLLAVGVLLLAGQCLFGALRVQLAWPIACYPLFDDIREPVMDWPEFKAIDASGEELVLDDDPIRDTLGDARYVPFFRRLLKTPLDIDDGREVVTELVRTWRSTGSLPEDESGLERLVVTRATYELSGPKRPDAPVATEPLAEFDWDEVAGGEG